MLFKDIFLVVSKYTCTGCTGSTILCVIECAMDSMLFAGMYDGGEREVPAHFNRRCTGTRAFFILIVIVAIVIPCVAIPCTEKSFFSSVQPKNISLVVFHSCFPHRKMTFIGRGVDRMFTPKSRLPGTG